jgi:hypothetical protein
VDFQDDSAADTMAADGRRTWGFTAVIFLKVWQTVRAVPQAFAPVHFCPFLDVLPGSQSLAEEGDAILDDPPAGFDGGNTAHFLLPSLGEIS